MNYQDESLKQYFLALVPPQPVLDAAMDLKNHFRDEYNSKAALNSPPHITLHMPFKWKEAKEEKLKDALRTFAKRFPPLTIALKNFGSFPPRVIFIQVERNDALIVLQKELMRYCKMELNLFNADYRDLPFHPHITLAFRDLKKPAYQEAWVAFEKKEFNAAFRSSAITLLKHDGKKWSTYEDFLLGG